MKIFKILLAVLLIYGAGNEYINASRQLLSFYDPGIIAAVLLMLILCAWLLGSGIAKQKIRLLSWPFLSYFAIAVALFVCFAFMSLVTFKMPADIVKVNGIDVNIAEFMNGSKRIVPDEKQRRAYCICVVTKLTADKELAEKHRREFETGKFSEVIINIQNNPDGDNYNLQECAGTIADVEWTPAFEQGARRTLMKQLTDLQKSSTNNLDIYCDCLINEYKKVPIAELTSDGFGISETGMKIDSLCDQQSKLKQ
ncbi:MAG: hypothetical protein GXC73_18880 [Chitinophagaceae bacterium]|nr:hypothetical protein [Chitinophagaceae bacterium]